MATGFAWRGFDLKKPARLVLVEEHILAGNVVDDLGAPMPNRTLSVWMVSPGLDYDPDTGGGAFRRRRPATAPQRCGRDSVHVDIARQQITPAAVPHPLCDYFIKQIASEH